MYEIVSWTILARSKKQPVCPSPETADLFQSFQSSLLGPHSGRCQLSELLSNQKRLPLAEGAGYAKRR